MKLGLVIGRFQPLHNGHISLINKALEENDKVLVLIGSSNKLPDFKNPFSTEQRVEFLAGSFGDEENIIVNSIKDYDSDDEWVQEVTARALSIQEDPTQIMFYCNPKDEEWYRRNFLFPVATLNEVDISATGIRESWYETGQGFDFVCVPAHVNSIMDELPDFDRLQWEYTTTTRNLQEKTHRHPFNNPMEPVSFAVIVQDGKVLVGKRVGPRGAGQFGLPGGFVENTETTLDAAMRETKEELGIDLKALITQGKAVCMAQAVSENLRDLGARTLGVNYLFVVKPDVTLDIHLDIFETSETQWVPMMDICEDKYLLFFNHNQVVRQLLSKVGGSK